MWRKSAPKEPLRIKVLAAVLEKNGRWLIARRKTGDRFAGLWEFPGGKIKRGETHQECLARELNEEFGIRVRVGRYLGSVRYRSADFAIELIAYRVSHLTGRFHLRDHEEIRWVPAARIGRWALTEPDRLLLQKIAPRRAREER